MSSHSVYQRQFDESTPIGTDLQCPECSARLRRNPQETACIDCGLVVCEQAIDRGPRWDDREDGDVTRERTGAPLSPARHDRGLSTEIGHGVAADGAGFSPHRKRRLSRLRREHNRAQASSKRERNRRRGIVEIRRICGRLDLPTPLRDRACTLFRQAQDDDLLIGRSLLGFAAAAVYGACRSFDLPRTMAEVRDAAASDRDSFRTAYSVLAREYGLDVRPAAPADFIPRLAAEFDVPQQTRRLATDIAHAADEANAVVGRKPFGVAAACLYLAADDLTRLTQARVAEAANVCPGTIRSVRRELQDAPEIASLVG